MTELLIPITDRLHLVNSPTGGRFPFAFSFLVMGTDTHALIDTGCGDKACRAVEEKYGVDLVINSHCHPDHVSGNHLFAGNELWIPEERASETGAVATLARRLLGPDPVIMANWENFVRSELGMRDYAHTRTYTDKERLDFGGITLQAIHTPGHLDDHYCFWEQEANILLTFDMDLTTFGPFYGNPEADIPLFRSSLEKIIAMRPDVVVSSHRFPVREHVEEELRAFLDKFKRNRDRVASVLDAPRTLEEVCALKPIFGKYIPGLEVIYGYFERHMVEKHLEGMEKDGLVEVQGSRFRGSKF
ncbi:MAG: MBL fold metallo-hydrolase [Desulfobacterales bacterium]|nr:MBL fold metallo-hydrolase [Desulfobacterales bacterium]